MQLHQLVYFTKVADTGSINKAAEELFLSQPNLSRSISSLESEIGVQLFVRNNKGVALTEDGKKLYEYASVILNQMEIISRMSPQKRSVALCVSSYPILLNTYACADFYKEHKDVRINFLEERIENVISHVEEGIAEIGIIHFNNRQKQELQNILHYKNLESHLISSDTWYANLGENNPYYSFSEVTMEQLRAFPLACLSGDYFYNLSLHLQIGGFFIRELSFFNFDSHGAIIEFIQNTDAFRFGPGWSYYDLAKKNIRTIPIKDMDLTVYCAWIKRKKELLSPEANAFLEILKGYYNRGCPVAFR